MGERPRSRRHAQIGVRVLRPTCTLVILVASPARADLIPSPPDNCPEGYTPTSSHGGPQCLAPAPTDCPSGWRGIPGGECMLDTCADDRDCHGGRRCVAQSICYVERTRHWREGPNREPDYRPRWVCGGKLSCRSPAECRPGKLCLAPGTQRGADSPNPRDASEAAHLPGGCSGCRRRQAPHHEVNLTLLLALGASLWPRRRSRDVARGHDEVRCHDREV